jgi:hypothetical protein
MLVEVTADVSMDAPVDIVLNDQVWIDICCCSLLRATLSQREPSKFRKKYDKTNSGFPELIAQTAFTEVPRYLGMPTSNFLTLAIFVES